LAVKLWPFIIRHPPFAIRHQAAVLATLLI
jgi:hypothetical protein